MDPDTLSLVIGVAIGTAPIAYGYLLTGHPTDKDNQAVQQEPKH